MKTMAVDKARGETELSRPVSDESPTAASLIDVSAHLEVREREVQTRTASVKLPICLIGLVIVAVAAAIGYGRYTTACYAQLVSSVDRDALLSVVRMGYESSRFDFTRLAAITVFGGLCTFFMARRVLLTGTGSASQNRANLMALACLFTFMITIYPSPLSWVGPRQQVVGTLLVAVLGLLLFAFVKCFRGEVAGALAFLRRLLFETRVEMLMLCAFAAVLLMSAFASHRLFDQVPHVQDSIDQLFQSKMFLQGKLYVPSPTPRASFDFLHMINNGHWYSQYPPGHSLLLALALLVNAPWLVNPLCGALSCLLMYPLGKEMFDDKTGRLAMLLAAISPFLIFMSSEFMNHASALLFWQAGMLGYVRMLKYRRLPDAILTGVGFGFGYLIRPLTLLSLTAPLVAFVLPALWQARAKRQAKPLFKVGALSAFVAGVFVSASLLYNQLTNGSPWLSGYEVCWGKGHLPGFGHAGWGPPHTPELGWVQSLANLNQLNLFLFGWPIPALLLVGLALAFGKRVVWDYLLICTAGALCCGYFFYWYQDACFGPRQMFECSAALVLLTARFFRQITEICSKLFQRVDRALVDGCTFSIACACVIFAIYGHAMSLMDLYGNNYWGTDRNTVKAVRELSIHNAVVFMKSNYGSVFAENSPMLDSDIVYARDCGPGDNALVASRFLTRSLYIADGDRVEPYRNSPSH